MKEIIEKNGTIYTIKYLGAKLAEKGESRIKILKSTTVENSYVLKRKDDGTVVVAYRQRRWRTAGERLFVSTEEPFGVGVRNGRAFLRCGPERDFYYFVGCLVGFFCDESGLECLYRGETADKDIVFCRAVSNKTVLKKVFQKKITNRRDLIREFLKSSYKIRNANVDLFDEFLSQRDVFFSVQQLVSYTTNHEKAMRRILDIVEMDRAGKDVGGLIPLIRDILGDCELLCIRFNPMWSKKRLEAFHQENSRKIIDALSDSMDANSVYGNERIPSISEGELQGSVIDSEKSAYIESQEMSHCFFYNYFPQVVAKGYVGLSISAPERCTVGIMLDKDRRPMVEQVRTYRNRCVKPDTFSLITDFVKEHCKQLADLFSKTAPAGSLSVRPAAYAYDDEDLPF